MIAGSRRRGRREVCASVSQRCCLIPVITHVFLHPVRPLDTWSLQALLTAPEALQERSGRGGGSHGSACVGPARGRGHAGAECRAGLRARRSRERSGHAGPEWPQPSAGLPARPPGAQRGLSAWGLWSRGRHPPRTLLRGRGPCGCVGKAVTGLPARLWPAVPLELLSRICRVVPLRCTQCLRAHVDLD